MTLLRPRLAGEFWLLGPAPRLPQRQAAGTAALPECVDHHLFKDIHGSWHLWGCIRGTPTGRILYHWEGDSLEQGPWRPTGEYLRPQPSAGESIADWEGQEWIQSPFVVRDRDSFYFFYGGHSTGLDRLGRPVAPGDPGVECQICLMTSQDGRSWLRHVGENGMSRVFAGPGEARDPCVIRIGEAWHMYYAGYESGEPLQPGIYLRTSLDLVHWSPSRLVHRSHHHGVGRWTHECPQVVQRQGTYYLFRTEDYDRRRTHAFWSGDPTDFGVDQAEDRNYLGLLPVAAPEIIVAEDGREYITSCHDLTGGIQICRLAWSAG